MSATSTLKRWLDRRRALGSSTVAEEVTLPSLATLPTAETLSTVEARTGTSESPHVVAATTACHAPNTSLYLGPRGEVQACCQNVWHQIGHAADGGLTAAWHSEAMDRLRDAVAIGDLSLGCERCARRVSAGQADSAFARVYDRFGHGPAPEWPRQLELALSNACNLQCVMCNGDLSSSIRIHRERRSPLPTVYGDEFFAELDLFLPHLESVVFLGGEPFLGSEPLRVMHRLIELGLHPSCSITTNGTVWSDRVREIVQRLPMHITISLDGHSREVFEGIRVGADHGQVLSNLENFRDATRDGGGSVSLAFCLMSANYHELAPLLVWANNKDLSVFVNEVTHPPHLGLLHSSKVDLTEVLAVMEQQSVDLAQRMGANRSVWERELANVRRLEVQATVESNVRLRVRSKPPTSDEGMTICRAVMAADSRQLVTSVEVGGDWLGLEMASLIGQSIWDVQQRLARHLGRLASTVLSRLDDGSEVLEISFETEGSSARLDALMQSNADGTQRWELQLTHASTTGSVGGDASTRPIT